MSKWEAAGSVLQTSVCVCVFVIDANWTRRLLIQPSALLKVCAFVCLSHTDELELDFLPA